MQGVHRLKNSLEEFRVPRSSGGTTFSYAGRNQVKELAERRGQRWRPLVFEILPSMGRKYASSGGSIVAVRSAEKEEDLDHWFLCPGGSQEKPTEGRY
jgi:hypothetical protein